MWDCIKLRAYSLLRFAFLAAGICFSVGLSGCGSSKPAQQEQGPHRYPLAGRVVSVDKGKQQVTVDGDDVPGFMSAMTMEYGVKNPNLLETISPEDQIKADVVVNNNDVWLENIVVVKRPDRAKTPSAPSSPAKQ